MARLVNITVSSDIQCNVVTNYENGSSTTRVIKAGDITEDNPIRYVSNKQILSAVGRVMSVNTICNKISKIDISKPEDNFAKDFSLSNIRLDGSEKFYSNLISVPCKEIVEDEGVTSVTSVNCYAHPVITLILTYTDGSTVEQSLEVGDVLDYVKIMTTPGKKDIEGSFKVAAFGYTKNANRPKFDSVILVPYGSTTGNNVRAYFDKIISFEEVPSIEVTDTTSLGSIATTLASSENGKAQASLGVDVTIPAREDGRITTLMVNKGQELDIDLNSHTLNCEAYAFYVNGGTLNIYDDSKTGKIEARKSGVAYPTIFIASDGVCNMYGGTLDTTPADSEETYNWMYGAVCSGNGVFNMYGGKMIISGAAGISITNGTASGEGAKFTITGKSEITSLGCAGIYLADNKSVVVGGNAVINSGIVARMGDITIQDNAVVNSITDPDKASNLGGQACFSGVDTPKAGILALTGVYGSSLGNDLHITVKDKAKVNGYIDDAIDIAFVNTKYDQTGIVDIEKSSNVTGQPYRIYTHDELAALATEVGKTLGAETNTTTLTVNIDGEQVYPVL